MERTNVRTLTPDAARRSGRADRRRPFFHLAAAGAARAGRLHRGRRRPRADGQAAVRGRQGAGRLRRGRPGSRCCAPRRCSTSPPPGWSWGSASPGVAASPLPGPSGNVEFFVWFRRDAPPADAERVHAVVAAGPSGAVASAGPAPMPVSPPAGGFVSRPRLLVTHTGRRQSTQHAQTVARDLVAAGFEVRVIAEEVDDLELPPGVTPVDDPTAAEGVEIVFALGGDGTFLRAAELARPAKAPLLGINLGKVGFLAEAELNNIDQTVRRHRRRQLHGGRAAHPGRAGRVRRPADRRLVGAQRGQRREGAAGPDARTARRRGRPAAVAVRLRRCRVRHPDRVDGVRVLGGRAGGVARGRGAAAGADQRPRAVQPAAS